MGSFKSPSYIRLLDWQAEKAAQRLAETGQITVVVQDNGPLHTSKAVQAKYRDWEQQGLYFFFLAKYCSQMNPIEHEWQHLKAQELAGRMFEDEYDLALAVMDGVKARAQKGRYATERFMFNST